MKKVHSKRNSMFNARLMEKWGYKRDEEELTEEDESIAEEESLDESEKAGTEAGGISTEEQPDESEDENLEEVIRREIRKALQKGGE
tara:strand:+ start:361 stop:621 length:261 start_codon:yes stop_codon:yes gene_type:complete